MRKFSVVTSVIVVLLLAATTVLAANIFNYRAGTGDSGANRFWVNDRGYWAAGADVQGRFHTTDAGAWYAEAQRLYGVSSLCTITGPNFPEPRFRPNDGDFILSGNDVAGRCIFELTDLEIDYTQVCDNITGPNVPAPRFRPNDGDFILSGGDVAGRCIFGADELAPQISKESIFSGSERALSGYMAFLEAAAAAGL